MNYLSLLRFYNFRNLEDQEIELFKSINVFIGNNGSGKTNILESLSLLNQGKGFRKEILFNIKKFNKNEPWIIFSKYNNSKIDDIACSYEEKESGSLSKNLIINGTKIKKIKNVDNFPIILWFIPEMESLFNGSPSYRRNFFDRIVFSFDTHFLDLMNSYLKLIKERSFILQNSHQDKNWLNEIEHNIAKKGIEITTKRKKTLEIINETFKKISSENKQIHECKISLVGKIEDNIINNSYEDSLNKYINILDELRKEDSFRGGCGIGPHKSDFDTVYLKNNVKASFSSTGQQKEIILSIILCQSYCLMNIYKKTPIILLDEICSHLDDNTRGIILNLIKWLKTQVLITGTDKSHFSFLSKNVRFFDVKNGKINPI